MSNTGQEFESEKKVKEEELHQEREKVKEIESELERIKVVYEETSSISQKEIERINSEL